MWEMASVCWKWLKYVGNDLIIWQMASIFGKWLRGVENDLDKLEKA